MNKKPLIGMSLEEAQKKLSGQNYRLIKKDSGVLLTADYDETRLNVVFDSETLTVTDTYDG